MFKILLSVFLLFSVVTNTFASDDFCFTSVAKEMNLDVVLIEAISYVESKHDVNAVGVNADSIDYGHMQINSYWIDRLGDDYLELNDACYCTQIGAEILSDCINSYGYNRDAISCYNSGKPLRKLKPKTKTKVLTYIKKVKKRYEFLLGENNE